MIKFYVANSNSNSSSSDIKINRSYKGDFIYIDGVYEIVIKIKYHQLVLWLHKSIDNQKCK